MDEMFHPRVGIIGLGLIGGSLARSLKNLPSPPFIRALSLDQSDLEEGIKAGAVDQAMSTPEGFFHGLDLVVFCTPLNTTLDLLKAHRDRFGPETLITDTVSLKSPILEMATSLGLGSVFVGSHPMAGGEGSGFLSSREGLFNDARVWVVAGEALPSSVERIQGFWASLGARVVRIGAGEHDEMMVWISHVPQLTANALASVYGQNGLRREQLGPGGRSMTRLAGSGPEMWADLLENAPDILPSALEEVERALAEVRSQILQGKRDDLADLIRRGRRWYEGGEWS